MVNDPNEWTNLAGDSKYDEIIEAHRKWIPQNDKDPAPNSASRIIIYKDGQMNWEGEDVAADAPIPEITR